MTDPAIIEAAARALNEEDGTRAWGATSPSDREWYTNLARAALAAVTPLIEARTLERAALMAEHSIAERWLGDQVAAAIRALKDQP